MGGAEWLRNTDVMFTLAGVPVSVGRGSLGHAATTETAGSDSLGQFTGWLQVIIPCPAPLCTTLQEWETEEGERHQTSARQYSQQVGGKVENLSVLSRHLQVVVMSQLFPTGLENCSLVNPANRDMVSTVRPFHDIDVGFLQVSTAYPALSPVADLSYLSYGGFMSGWAALSVGKLNSSAGRVRGGEYGGPLVLFTEEMDQVTVSSSALACYTDLE